MNRCLMLLAVVASAPLALGQFPRAATRAVPVRPVVSRSTPSSKASKATRSTSSYVDAARRRALERRLLEQRRDQPVSAGSMRTGCPTDQRPKTPLTSEQRAAKEFLKLRLTPKETKAAIKKVNTELVWHKRLSEAAKEAKKTKKPILWIQMLGKLDSFT